MRIAISGSHSVGKTRLSEQISEVTGIVRIAEIARQVAEKYKYKNTDEIKNANLEDRIMFQRIVLLEQAMEESLHHNGFISDRSIFDVIAYSKYYGLPADMIAVAENTAIKNSAKYDCILYCPIPEGVPPTDDGFRLVDKESQETVDEYIKELLIHAKCPILGLPTDRDQWLELSLKYIRRLEGSK